ncbi:hypothetical protein PVL30_003367 [Lodderomyces elongisporus]|uniref:uncharacterized protein n=1 Tax=Lodderomyces elongisporus TaxID=36914 RepID=UPI00291C730F|nr:uncharacterized protein PVL30_003367 [Lodderomyces elongisporus]WLF79611.1 hypothetical protein PVL30_003367 [Lodderomyces elongisporus]
MVESIDVNNRQEILVDPSFSLLNSFISSVDHLPCDIIRSLWLVQTCNLKIDKLRQGLNDILHKYQTDGYLKDAELATVYELQNQIKWLSKEAVSESKALNCQLITHKLYLQEEINQLHNLKNIEQYNSINDRHAMELLRKQLKAHYRENPLRSQVEALAQQQEQSQQSLTKQSQQSLPTQSQQSLTKQSQSEKKSDQTSIKKESSGLKLILRIPKHDKLDKKDDRDIKEVSQNNRPKLGRPKLKTTITPVQKPNKIVKPGEKAKDTRAAEFKKGNKKKITTQIPAINENNLKIIVSQNAVEKDEEDKRYCFCNQPSLGDMIACDNEDSCPNGEWFHYKCVGLLNRVDAMKYTTGKEQWFCSEKCREVVESKTTTKEEQKKRKRRKKW